MAHKKAKVVVAADKVERVLKVCGWRTKGSSLAMLAIDLDNFVKTELKGKYDGLKTLSECTKEEGARIKQIYLAYHGTVIKQNTLRRTFYEDGVTFSTAPFFNELLDLYLQEFEISMSAPEMPVEITVDAPVFSANAVLILAQRAGNLCSDPDCRKLTSGPVLSDFSKAYVLGVACPIHGSKPGDVRYDPQVPYKPDNYANGIWLCAYHAGMINANAGADYPASQLRKWKTAHEYIIKACNEGKKRICFELNLNDDQAGLAAEIIGYFNRQYLRLASPEMESRENLIGLVEDINDYLLEKKATVDHSTRLQLHMESIEAAGSGLVKFLEKTEDHELFRYAMAAFNKVVRLELEKISNNYNVPVPAPGKPARPDLTSAYKTEQNA